VNPTRSRWKDDGILFGEKGPLAHPGSLHSTVAQTPLTVPRPHRSVSSVVLLKILVGKTMVDNRATLRTIDDRFDDKNAVGAGVDDDEHAD
jgi:hypothetical protein